MRSCPTRNASSARCASGSSPGRARCQTPLRPGAASIVRVALLLRDHEVDDASAARPEELCVDSSLSALNAGGGGAVSLSRVQMALDHPRRCGLAGGRVLLAADVHRERATRVEV